MKRFLVTLVNDRTREMVATGRWIVFPASSVIEKKELEDQGSGFTWMVIRNRFQINCRIDSIKKW